MGFNAATFSAIAGLTLAGSIAAASEAVSNDAIAGQRAALATATQGAGFGPQSPRDIDDPAGTNSRIFGTAPHYSLMNLCNIHFHESAEHKGGEFSICVPNARLYIDAYTSGKKLTSPFLGWKDALHGQTAIDMVNYIAYMDGHHRYMFDEDSLLARLREAGFTDVRLRDFDPSVDSPGRDFESIYAVGLP